MTSMAEFYDHVSPLDIPTSLPGHGSASAFATTGVRVPSPGISPLVDPASVFSERLDHNSFLQLIVDKFGQRFYSPAVPHHQRALGRLSDAITRTAPCTETPAALDVAVTVEPVAMASPRAAGADANAGAFRLAARKIVAEHAGVVAGGSAIVETSGGGGSPSFRRLHRLRRHGLQGHPRRLPRFRT